MNLEEQIEKAFVAGAEFVLNCKKSDETVTPRNIAEGLTYYLNGHEQSDTSKEFLGEGYGGSE